LKIEMNVVDKP